MRKWLNVVRQVQFERAASLAVNNHSRTSSSSKITALRSKSPLSSRFNLPNLVNNVLWLAMIIKASFYQTCKW